MKSCMVPDNGSGPDDTAGAGGGDENGGGRVIMTSGRAGNESHLDPMTQAIQLH
jgi:hypothetical protein